MGQHPTFLPTEGFSVPLAPAVPPKDDVFTFTRFGGSFEAHEYSGWIDESMSWKTPATSVTGLLSESYG